MRRLSAASAVLFCVLAATLAAQRPTDVVRWSAKSGETAKAGTTVRLEVTADVQPGWHLYALTQPKNGPTPLKFAVAKGARFEVRTGEVKGPAPVAVTDPNFDLETRQYDGTVVFTVPVAVAADAPTGAAAVPLEVTFQACGNGLCLRPFTHTLNVAVVVR